MRVSRVSEVLDAAIRSAKTVPGVTTVLGVTQDSIGDKIFTDQLDEVRNLKRFLFAEKTQFPTANRAEIDLGPLNNLKYNRYGRNPELGEWALLDEKMSALAGLLDPALRRKIKIWELGRYFGGMPLGFLICAILAVGIGFFFPEPFKSPDEAVGFLQRAPLFVSVVLWTIALGGLGACAFLSTTLLSSSRANAAETIPVPAAAVGDFDITDTRLINARLVVGLLFAFLLGFPFASASLRFVLDKLFQGTNDINLTGTEIAVMTAPFLMGFSTSLVLLILDRVVSAIKSLFGIADSK